MKINRSEFLKNLAIGVSAVSALSQIKGQAIQPEKKISNTIKKVTIVGAGFKECRL